MSDILNPLDSLEEVNKPIVCETIATSCDAIELAEEFLEGEEFVEAIVLFKKALQKYEVGNVINTVYFKKILKEMAEAASYGLLEVCVEYKPLPFVKFLLEEKRYKVKKEHSIYKISWGE